MRKERRVGYIGGDSLRRTGVKKRRLGLGDEWKDRGKRKPGQGTHDWAETSP